MYNLPHWIVIHGTDRYSGKTTLITKIIEHFSKDLPICGIKISPHFHPLDDQSQVIYQTGNWVILKENKGNTGKDSSRMLDAGAREVFYLQVRDNQLSEVIPFLLKVISPEMAVICESEWVRNLITPGSYKREVQKMSSN